MFLIQRVGILGDDMGYHTFTWNGGTISKATTRAFPGSLKPGPGKKVGFACHAAIVVDWQHLSERFC